MENRQSEFWCVTKKGVCIMVQDTRKKHKSFGFAYVYIPEKQWFAITAEQKTRYIV